MAMQLAAALASDRPSVAGSPSATDAPKASNDSCADRETFASPTRESADRRARFVGKLRKCRAESACLPIWKEVDEGLHKLTLDDADVVMRELAGAFERSFAKMPQAAEELRAGLTHVVRSPDAAAKYAALCESRRSERVRIANVCASISKLHQAAITLETDACKQPAKVTWHAIQELCCLAKLLQRDHGDLLTEKQSHLLHTEVFGRLRAIHKRYRIDYVPGLKTDWLPADLDVQCEAARAARESLLASASLPPAIAPLPPPTSEETAQRAAADAVALASVYRAINDYQRDPMTENAADTLRGTVLAALNTMGEGKERLPELLLPYKVHFENGSDFRWLRKKLAKLAEQRAIFEGITPDDVAAKPVEPDVELPISIPTAAGSVTHPSVVCAREQTLGKRVILVGGMVDEARRMRLVDSLGAESVEWIVTERCGGVVQASSAAERIRQGRVHFVIYLLRFVSHKVTEALDAAAREGGVQIVRVPNGLGVVGIADAICRLVRRNAS